MLRSSSRAHSLPRPAGESGPVEGDGGPDPQHQGLLGAAQRPIRWQRGAPQLMTSSGSVRTDSDVINKTLVFTCQ